METNVKEPERILWTTPLYSSEERVHDNPRSEQDFRDDVHAFFAQSKQSMAYTIMKNV